MDNKWGEAPKQPKQKARTNWWRVLALVLLPYAVFSWYSDPFTLEYYGYCKKDGVTRDPQALMNKYIETIIKEQAEAGDNYVKYSSVQDFYEKNPRCCRMYAWQSPQEYSWGWQQAGRAAKWILQDAYYQVSLAYRSRITDAQPYVESTPVIDVCGRKIVFMEGRAPNYVPPSGHAAFEFITGHLK